MAKSKATKGGSKSGKGSKGSKSQQKKQDKAKSGNKNKVVVVSKSRGSQDRLKLQQAKPLPKHINLSKESGDFRHIVRISNRDVPGYLSIRNGVNLVYGLGIRVSKIIEKKFFEKSKKVVDKIGYLKDEDTVVLDEIISNLQNYVPTWLLNRPKTKEGETKQVIMADLKLELRKDYQELGKIKSYRGLRLQWGLPVRGQKTRSTFRKSGTVGVIKKK